MTESSITERGAPDQADTRRRIWAIVGASSGNLVEWFDFLRLFILLALFRPYLFFHLAIPPPNCCRRQAYLPPDS